MTAVFKPSANLWAILAYLLTTALHGLHMLVGIGLLGWLIWRAHRREISSRTRTPVEVIGLYGSFADCWPSAA